MKLKNIFAIMICLAGALSSCSKEDNNVTGEVIPTPDKPDTSFSILSTDGKVLADGEEIAAKSYVRSVDVDNEQTKLIHGLKMAVSLRNNTAAPLKLTVSWKLLDSDYENIETFFTYCWTVCYDPPAPSTSEELIVEPNKVFEEFYGALEDLTEAESKFDAKIEFTITNVDNGESQKVVGHYIYERR